MSLRFEQSMVVVAAFPVLVALAGCGGAEPAEPAEPAPSTSAAQPGSSPQGEGEAIVESGDTGGSAQDPRISTSPGEEGGAVVLWPRVMGNEDEPAGMVQRRLRRLVQQAMPDAPVDVRPDPERSCPREGCKGVAVGALFAGMGNGCAVVAFVIPPGAEPMTLVPWAGGVKLKRTTIPFRDPVENHVEVNDFESCDELDGALAEGEDEVLEAIRRAAG